MKLWAVESERLDDNAVEHETGGGSMLDLNIYQKYAKLDRRRYEAVIEHC